MSSYLYRCTEQQLENHLQRVADAGDVVDHVIFKGGRDYVLVCRSVEPTVASLTGEDLRAILVSAVAEGVLKADAQTLRKMGRAIR